MNKEELGFLKRDLEMMAMNQKLFYSDRIKKRIDNLFNYLQWAESFVEPYKSIEKEFKKQNQTENAKPIINITIDEDLLEKVEDYQFENRIKNRSEAIRRLLIKAMEKEEN